MIGMYTDNWQPESEEARHVRRWISEAQTEAAKHGMTVEPFMFGVTFTKQVVAKPKRLFLTAHKSWREMQRTAPAATVQNIANAFEWGRPKAA